MTARPIKARELLDLAAALAPAMAGRGRPRTIWLRRAVSSAYCALFHELVDHATTELCGPSPAEAGQRCRAARWFAHSDVKTLAEA